jgi:PAS domain-containing protein
VEHRTLVDGRLRWLRQRAVLEFDSDGRALRAAGTVEDITERKTAEQALSESESSSDGSSKPRVKGIWTIDDENRTTFVNPRMAELLGCPAEQIIGRSPFDFMDPEMRRLVERKLIERRQGKTDQYELRLTRPDGSQLWTLLSTTP